MGIVCGIGYYVINFIFTEEYEISKIIPVNTKRKFVGDSCCEPSGEGGVRGAFYCFCLPGLKCCRRGLRLYCVYFNLRFQLFEDCYSGCHLAACSYGKNERIQVREIFDDFQEFSAHTIDQMGFICRLYVINAPFFA